MTYTECTDLTALISAWTWKHEEGDPWTSTVKDDVRHHLTTCPQCLSNRAIVSRYLDERRRMRPAKQEGIIIE
jgi:hypothetical protein